MMFLISFSENILFSLATEQGDRKEGREGVKRGEGEIKDRQLMEKKIPNTTAHYFWMCGSKGRACKGGLCLQLLMYMSARLSFV